MPWVRLDDHFDQHPKLSSVGPLGLALWVSGIAYCNRNLTDGFIPWSAARTLLSWEWLDIRSDPDPGKGYRRVRASVSCGHVGEDVGGEYVIDLLVAAGLWDEVNGGYAIHDYNDFQPTRAQVEAERAQKVAAGQAGGKAAAQARAVAERKRNGSRGPTDRVAESKPVPVPDPVPDPSISAAASAREESVALVFRAVEDLTGSLTRPVAEALNAELDAKRDPDWIVAACDEAAKANGRSWKYVEAILKRWDRDGFQAPRKDQRNGTAQHGTRQRTRYDDTLDAPD